MSRVRERERAGEAVRQKKSRPALCVATPIYSEVGAAMTGHLKVNGVGTLWLPGNDEVMAKEVGAVMIVWELWYGDSRVFYGKIRNDFYRRCNHAYAGYWRERMY